MLESRNLESFRSCWKLPIEFGKLTKHIFSNFILQFPSFQLIVFPTTFFQLYFPGFATGDILNFFFRFKNHTK